MQLTQFADHSLRVLVYLAAHSDRLATIDDIATAYGISRNHLAKIVHRLALAGYVATQRGRGGGLRLGRKLAAIRLGEVVRQMEPNFTVVECFDPAQSQCVLTPACTLKDVLGRATRAYLDKLDRITLADLVQQAAPAAAA